MKLIKILSAIVLMFGFNNVYSYQRVPGILTIESLTGDIKDDRVIIYCFNSLISTCGYHISIGSENYFMTPSKDIYKLLSITIDGNGISAEAEPIEFIDTPFIGED